MYSLDFWLAVAVLAAVPFWMAAYGGHVAAESTSDDRHRRYIRLKFWGIGLVGLVVAFAYQYRVTKSDENKHHLSETWQRSVTDKLNAIRDNPAYSNEQKQAVDKLQHEVSQGLPPALAVRKDTQPVGSLSELPSEVLAMQMHDLAKKMREDAEEYWNQDNYLDRLKSLNHLGRDFDMETVKKQDILRKDFHKKMTTYLTDALNLVRVALTRTLENSDDRKNIPAIKEAIRKGFDGYGHNEANSSADYLDGLAVRMLQQEPR